MQTLCLTVIQLTSHVQISFQEILADRDRNLGTKFHWPYYLYNVATLVAYFIPYFIPFVITFCFLTTNLSLFTFPNTLPKQQPQQQFTSLKVHHIDIRCYVPVNSHSADIKYCSDIFPHKTQRIQVHQLIFANMK